MQDGGSQHYISPQQIHTTVVATPPPVVSPPMHVAGTPGQVNGTPGQAVGTPGVHVRSGSTAGPFVLPENQEQSVTYVSSQSDVGFGAQQMNTSQGSGIRTMSFVDQHHGQELMVVHHGSQAPSPAPASGSRTVVLQPMAGAPLHNTPPYIQAFSPGQHGSVTYVQTPPPGGAVGTGSTHHGVTQSLSPALRIKSEAQSQQGHVNMDQLQPRFADSPESQMTSPAASAMSIDGKKRLSEASITE
ncbi:hypothetical protein HDU93_006184, partial [Gonapodya sp. JEL0774]